MAVGPADGHDEESGACMIMQDVVERADVSLGNAPPGDAALGRSRLYPVVARRRIGLVACGRHVDGQC